MHQSIANSPLFVVLYAAAACAREGDASDADEQAAAKATSRAQPDLGSSGRTGLISAEFDYVFASQQAMDAFYAAEARRSDKSAVATQESSSGSRDIVIPVNGPAQNIRYCVSNSFENAPQRRVEFADAARAWEREANVRFVHVPAQDASCTNAPNAAVDVRFFPSSALPKLACGLPPSLHPAAIQFWCQGLEFAPGAVAMNYNNLEGMRGNWPNLTATGALRHELGHVLGLRHEDAWAPNRQCIELPALPFAELNGRQLTAYDRQSVMHVPSCGGDLNTSFAITQSDGVGIRSLYGMPASWYATL